MLPPASIATIAASLATFAGAAFIALAINSASLGAFALALAFFSGFAASAANVSVVTALAIETAIKHLIKRGANILFSSHNDDADASAAYFS
jgi:hypothetical protein